MICLTTTGRNQFYTPLPEHHLTEYANKILKNIRLFPSESKKMLQAGLCCNLKNFEGLDSLQNLFDLIQERAVFQKILRQDYSETARTLLYIELSMLTYLDCLASELSQSVLSSVVKQEPSLQNATIEMIQEFREVVESNGLLVSKEKIEFLIEKQFSSTKTVDEEISSFKKDDLNFEELNALLDLLSSEESSDYYKLLFVFIQIAKLHCLNVKIEKTDRQSILISYLHEDRLCVIDSLRSYLPEFEHPGYTRFLTSTYRLPLDVLCQLSTISHEDLCLRDYVSDNYVNLFLDSYWEGLKIEGKLLYQEKITDICREPVTLENVEQFKALLTLYMEIEASSQSEIHAIFNVLRNCMRTSLENLEIEPIHPKIKAELIKQLSFNIEIEDRDSYFNMKELCLEYCNRIQLEYGTVWKLSEIEKIRSYQTLERNLMSVFTTINLLKKDTPFFLEKKELSLVQKNCAIAYLLEEERHLEQELANFLSNPSLYQTDTILVESNENNYAGVIIYMALSKINPSNKEIETLENLIIERVTSPIFTSDLNDGYEKITSHILNLNHYYQMIQAHGDLSLATINTQIRLWKKIVEFSTRFEALQLSAQKNIAVLRDRIVKRGLTENPRLLLVTSNEYTNFLNSYVPSYVQYLEEKSSAPIVGNNIFTDNLMIASFESFSGEGVAPSGQLR